MLVIEKNGYHLVSGSDKMLVIVAPEPKTLKIKADGLYLGDLFIMSEHETCCCENVWVEWHSHTYHTSEIENVSVMYLETIEEYGLKLVICNNRVYPVVIDIPAYGADNYYSDELELHFYVDSNFQGRWNVTGIAMD